MDARSPETTPAERRLRREAQSAAMRERTLALRQAGATYAAIARDLGLSPERARQVVFKAERLARAPHWYDDLPDRAVHLLRGHELLDRPGLGAAHALAQASARELMRTPNFGQVSLNALRGWLAGHGLKLRPESAHAFATRLRREHSHTRSGAPARERPSDSDDGPLAAGRNKTTTPCPYYPTSGD